LLTPWIFAVLGVLWFLGCGFVLWLAWRAARSDEQTQQETQEPEAGTDLGPTDRAA
jgi:threonine/homoserine/homoserine lactone efflux protein